MVCRQCGCDQRIEAIFCRQCGSPLRESGADHAPFTPHAGVAAPLRLRQHSPLLGIAWCIFGVYRLVALWIAIVTLKSIADEGVYGGLPHNLTPMMHQLMPMIWSITVALAAADIFTGYSLLQRKRWGRVMAIIMGILALLKFPVGTALGVYTLWSVRGRARLAPADAPPGKG